MSGSSSKEQKEKKKQEKEQIKEFKKAFKKKTGVATDSKDSGKLIAAFQEEVKELAKWTGILVKVQPLEREIATDRLTSWNMALTTCQQLAKTDKKGAAVKARDMVAVLIRVNETVRKQAKRKPVTQTVGDRDVSVFITDIVGYDKMNPQEREEALIAAAGKTAKGLDLYDKIADGTLDVDDRNLNVQQDEVENMIWAMKSKAQEKNGGPYQKGAMTVPNGEKLRKFMDKCPEVYSRLSSHLREQQGRNKEGAVAPKNLSGQTPRGMDFYNPDGDEKPGRLPAGMNALLFQQVILPGGNKALYIKMESEGSFGHSEDTKLMSGPLANRAIDDTVPPDRAPHPNDGKRSLKHFKNLIIKAKGDDKDLAGLREQTPKEVAEAIKAIVSAVEGKKAKAFLKTSYGTEPKRLLFKKFVPRIAYFLDAFEQAQDHDGEKGWEIGDKALALFPNLNGLLRKLFPADDGDSERRLGGEVVVTEDDMANGQDDSVYEMPDDDDEDELSASEDEEQDPEFRIQLLRSDCASLVELVRDPELKKRLQTIVYEEILDGRDDAFTNFSKAVGKSDVEALGRAASKFADKLLPQLDRV